MTISQLALAAKRVIEAAWLHSAPYDLAAQAAFALESAQMLQSPETAADAAVAANAVALLDEAVAELKREHEENARLRRRIAELESERHSTNEALDDAVQELRARRSDEPVETVTVRPVENVTPQVAKLRALLAGQREVVDGEHYATVHHDYREGRDLPPMGGPR